MLVFAGITPHPPILIPNVGKDNIKQIAATVNAMNQLEKDLYAAEPDVIMVISPHAELNPDAFLLNLSADYIVNFEEFGDLETKLTFKDSPKLCMDIQERVEDNANIKMYLTSQEKLDHGTGVALYYLTKHLKNISIVPLSISMLPLDKHVIFGQELKKEIAISEKRIAFIASGDLSHRLKKGAPAGFAPEGEKFDKELIEKIKAKDLAGILKMDNKFVDKAGECGLRSVVTLMGLLEEVNYQPEVLSYEGPFGVGYLVANMKIK